ncbi:helicase associated domain-containing protein [Streptomyces mirabilis]|uniref:helicase associated domain-containing protein n=1 Tax=Streptomyces mirabilis TaxID=68239 RepID=UPI0036AE40D8
MNTPAHSTHSTPTPPSETTPWPQGWQRHYRVLAGFVDTEAGGALLAIEPGVVFEGDDLGRWLERQSKFWAELSAEQQRRLSVLGMTPAVRPAPAPGPQGRRRATGKASAAWQRGITTLAQRIECEGTQKAVLRGGTETVVIDGQEHQHELGVCYANQNSAAQTQPRPAHRTPGTGCRMGVAPCGWAEPTEAHRAGPSDSYW